MYTMNVVWTGECDSLIAARDKSVAAIKSADGLSANVSITAPGANNTIKQLGQVHSLAQQIGGTTAVTVTAGGVGEAQGQLRDLRRDVNGAAADLKSGLSLNVGGSQGALQLANNLGAATNAFADTTRGASEFSGQLGGVGRAAADTNARMRSVAASTNEASSAFDGYSGSGSYMSGVNSIMADSAGQSAAQMERQSTQVATLTRGLDDAGQSYRSLGADMSSMSEQSIRAQRAWNSGLSQDRMISIGAGEESGVGIPGTPHGPPPTFHFGGGGGGGGGGDDEPSRLQKLMSMGESGGAGGPLMMGTMGAAVGVVESLGTAAIGAMAVNEAIKHTPALAYAANEAMQQMDRGITQAASRAVAEGVPAFQQLGAALKPLGTEIGNIGADNIGAVLGGATRLAGDATQALHTLEPAFGPAINGAVALGEALLNGVSSPAVVDSINAVSKTLQNPGTEDTISKGVTGLLTGAGYVASGVGDALSDISTTHAPTSDNQQMGQWVASHSGGVLSYDPQADYGQTGLPTPGQGTGVVFNQNSAVGRWATAAGSLSSLWRASVGLEGWGEATSDVSNRFSNAFTGTPGQGPAGQNDQSTAAFPQDTAPGKYGFDVDKSGNLQPSYSQYSGGGYLAPETGGYAPPQTGSPTYIPKGPGSSALPMSANDVNQLTAAMNTASPSMTNFARNTTQASQQLQQMPQSAQQVAPPLQNMHSALSQVQQSTQQFQQSVQPAARAVQQLPQQVQPAMQSLQQMPQMALQPLQQMPQQAQQQLQQAQQQVQQSAQQIGQQVPQSMGQGIQQNTGAACNAAADLSANAKKCAGDAMGAASPAKDFIQLGLWAGEGLQIGFQQGTGNAAAAAGQMAAATVASAGAAIGAASPATQFQALGRNTADAMAGQYQGPFLNALGERMPPPPRFDDSKYINGTNRYDDASRRTWDSDRRADDSASRRNSDKHEDQWRKQRDEELKRRGWTDKTRNDVLERERRHNEIANKHARDRNEAHAKAMYEARYGIAAGPLAEALYRDAAKDPITGKLLGPLPSPERASLLHSPEMERYRREHPNSPELRKYWQQQHPHDANPNDPRNKDSKQNDPKKSNDPWRDNRSKALDKFGWTAKTKNDVLDREGRRRELDNSHKQERKDAADHAKSLSRQMNNNVNDMTKGALGPASAGGLQISKEYEDAISRGIDVGNGKVKEAAEKQSKGMIDLHKKKLGVNSPSTVYQQIGEDTMAGLANGLASGSGAIQGVASNTGLMVGYVWGQSVVNGGLSVIKSADFTTAAVSGVGSALAETALGQLGLLGPAGPGGEIGKTPAVTLGLTGSSSVTPQVTVGKIVAQFGSQTIESISQDVFDANMTGLANALTMQ